MRTLEETISQSTLSQGSKLKLPVEGSGPRLYNWIVECHGFMHNGFLIITSILFVLYLALQAKRSYAKLSNGRSHIMIAYYACLWLVSLFNLAWSCFQTWECTSGKELAWNLLTLCTTSGMLFLEVSLVAFLLQGNYASSREALTQTFVVSGIIVCLDILLKAIYLFGFGIPLFIETDESTNRVKWGLWAVHRLLLTAVYGFIFLLYHSRWNERLPARPAFYRYVAIMFFLNAIALFACGLSGNGANFGLWLYGIASVCYHAFYLPLLYITFLADFFQEEDLQLDNVYYSEMKDAGFFDADWE